MARPKIKKEKTASGNTIRLGQKFGTQGVGGKADYHSSVHLPHVGFMKFDVDDLALGDFYQMKDYYQIKTSMAMTTFTIMSLNWWIEGGTKEINEAVRWQIDSIWTELVRTMSKAFWAGYSPNVKVFDLDDKEKYLHIKEIRDLSPFMCRVHIDKKDQSFDGFIQKEGDYTVNEIRNGSLVQTTEHVDAKYIKPEYSFWYSFMMNNGNFEGEKLLKGAYIPWFFSQVIHLYQNKYFYRFSTPLAKGFAPTDPVEDSNGVTHNAQDIMIELLQEIRNNSSVSLPNDLDDSGERLWDIEYMDSQLRGYDFDSYLKRLDKEMTKALFMPDLLFESGGKGSYKLGEVHKSTFLMLLNAIMNDMKRFIDKYIIEQFVDNNFAPSSKRKAPKPVFKYERQGTISTPIIVSMIDEMVKKGKIDASVQDIANITGVPFKETQSEDDTESVEDEEPTKVNTDNRDDGEDEDEQDIDDDDTNIKEDEDGENSMGKVLELNH